MPPDRRIALSARHFSAASRILPEVHLLLLLHLLLVLLWLEELEKRVWSCLAGPESLLRGRESND